MITINKISLKNFMSIESLSLSFSNDTIVAITGENGSGKSALLYAIAFAITGYRKGESYRDYVRTGCDSATINLLATLKGYPVEYEIELAGNSKKGAIAPTKRKVTYKDKVYLNSDYNQFIKEHELDYIESLMFLFQGSNDIINVRPAERAATLRRLFQFEFGDIVKAFKSKMEELKIKNIELASQISELSSRKFDKQPLIRTLTKEGLAEKKASLFDVSSSLSKLLNIDESSIEKYDQWLAEVNSSISSLECKIERDEKSANQWMTKKQKLLEEVNRVSSDELSNNLAEAVEVINKLALEIEDFRKNSQDLQYKIKLLRHDVDEITSQITICKTGICHACGHKITPSYTEGLVNQLADKQQDLKVLVESFNQLTTELSKKTSAKTSEEKRANALKNQLDALEVAKSSIESCEENFQRLQESLADKNTDLQRLLRDKTRISAEKEELDKIKPLLLEKHELELKRDALEESIHKAESDIIRNEEKRLSNKLVEEESRKRDATVKEMVQDQNDVQLSIGNTKACIEVFDTSFPNFIILQACEQLEDFINDIVQRIFPYMKVSLKLSRSGVNFYYLSESSAEEWIAVSMASGAQKTVLSLAYQIALAKMYGLTAIFLDEADAAMSDENAKIVYDFIASLDDFQQIFFISHRKEAIETMLDSGRGNVEMYRVSNGEYEKV